MFTTIRNTNLLWILANIHAVSVCGIRSLVRIQENTDAADTMSMMDAVEHTVSFKPCTISFTCISR